MVDIEAQRALKQKEAQPVCCEFYSFKMLLAETLQKLVRLGFPNLGSNLTSSFHSILLDSLVWPPSAPSP